MKRIFLHANRLKQSFDILPPKLYEILSLLNVYMTAFQCIGVLSYHKYI
jgi:hypothetical protein